MKKIYKAEIDCANCALKMEKAILKIKGVKNASVNFMAGKITLDGEEERFVEIEKEMVKAVKKVEPDCAIKL